MPSPSFTLPWLFRKFVKPHAAMPGARTPVPHVSKDEFSYFKTAFGGKFSTNMVYRAYRVPYEWIPQLERPEEISVEPVNVETFRVPGSLVGKAYGKVTVVDGVDPLRRVITGSSADDDERVDSCVVSVKKSDVIK